MLGGISMKALNKNKKTKEEFPFILISIYIISLAVDNVIELSLSLVLIIRN